MKKMKRYFIKDKNFRRFLEQLPESLRSTPYYQTLRKRGVEKLEFGRLEVYLADGRPMLVRKNNGKVFPPLLFSEVVESLPKVIVDMGAVPHVCKGANVMRPGVVKVVGDFDKRMLVVIVDETHNKPIAVGLALLSSQDLSKVRTGKVVETIHYVGDETWRLLRSVVGTT